MADPVDRSTLINSLESSFHARSSLGTQELVAAGPELQRRQLLGTSFVGNTALEHNVHVKMTHRWFYQNHAVVEPSGIHIPGGLGTDGGCY